MSERDPMILVRVLRAFSYNERALERDDIVQMPRRMASTFQNRNLVSIENLQIDQVVDGRKVEVRSSHRAND